MKYAYVLAQDASGGLRLRAGGCSRRVVTVTQACRLLRRTRRQVYRHIRAGAIEPRGKILGEWVLDADSVGRLAGRPLTAQPLPSRLQAYFPEHEVSRLNAGRDNILVISRILEGGGLGDLRWLFRRYGRAEIRRCVREEGRRLLGPRSLRLWSLLLKVRPDAATAWRADAVWPGENPTGLALRLGHRVSLDLDLKPPASWRGLPVASPEDISAMKLSAVVSRGSRKDFIDLYHLCRADSLDRVLGYGTRKFKDHADFAAQALRALVYFEDAEKEPMPRLLQPLSWTDVRTFFEASVTRLLQKKLGSGRRP